MKNEVQPPKHAESHMQNYVLYKKNPKKKILTQLKDYLLGTETIDNDDDYEIIKAKGLKWQKQRHHKVQTGFVRKNPSGVNF